MDFNEMAKQKYNELEKQEKELKDKLAGIKNEKEPLRKYLIGAGVIEVKKRGRKKKTEEESA